MQPGQGCGRALAVTAAARELWQQPHGAVLILLLLLCRQARCPSEPRAGDHSSLGSVCSSEALP